MQAQTFMLTFFIFIAPHSFPVTPGEKIPQVSVFCGFVGAKHVQRMEEGRLPKEVMKWHPPGRRK
jgi:hypothetical protein